MIITCGNCGQKIEIDAATPDGTHVRCPYCNEKSMFSRPVRVEIPGGLNASTARRLSPQPPPEPPTPASSNADYEAALRARRVAEVEERVQDAERMNAHAMVRDQQQARQRKIETFAKLAVLLAVLGVMASASWWLWSQRKEKQENARRAAEIVAQRNAEEEMREAAEREERERQRQAEREERERQRQIEEAERERQRQAKEAERKKEEEARRAEDERRRAEDERRYADMKASRKLFSATEDAFACGAFHFIADLPRAKCPGVCEGTFYYLLPRSSKARPSFVVCESSTNGTVMCYRLFENGDKEPYETTDDFLKSVNDMDYLMLAPDKDLYFHSRRRKDHVGEISKKKVEDVVEAFFGDIAKDVTRLVSEFDEISFEIVFMPKSDGGKKAEPILVETLDYGLRYSLHKVRDAIEDAFPAKASAGKVKRKRQKRTVVFWDGSMIKKGIDGVTYVPRSRPTTTRTYRTSRSGHSTYTYSSTTDRTSQWRALYDEALRQEAQEREVEQGRAQKGADDYRRRIDKILSDGTLFFRARVKNQ